MAKKKPTFENSIIELQEIIENIENGEIPLKESIELYKKGMNICMDCGEILSAMEEEVTVLYENAVNKGELKEEFREETFTK